MAAAAAGGARGALPGPAIASGPCAGRAPAAWLRRDAQRRNWRVARPAVRAFRRWPAVLHPGRIAGRRRKPGRASGDDDPCGDVGGGARRRRHRRGLAAPVGRHRERGGPAGGSGGGIRARRGAAQRRRAATPSGSKHDRHGVDCRRGRAGARRATCAGTRGPARHRHRRHGGAGATGRLGGDAARRRACRWCTWPTRAMSAQLVASGIARACDATRTTAPGRHRRARWQAVELSLQGDGRPHRHRCHRQRAVAEHHASWLAQGIHVVTACKLGPGHLAGALARDSRGVHRAAARITATAPPSAPACRCCAPSASCRPAATASMRSPACCRVRWRGCATTTTACARSPASCARRATPATPNPIRARTCPARTCAASC